MGYDKDTKPKNSSMVRNEEELQDHSKIMEHVSSNVEVKKSGKTPDPEQHDDKDEDK
ncbi:hypothetical protein [Alkalihalobacillus sp. AL-G]|uniref:hypothetical protein n=1 Tax=Alkalihalobacillus sp. AL-G TaxID=2926399 RepID=UPI00272C2CAC|nr:hypothetical protein [Alkalihalobacillus sp. AL-G]WLD94014.1 hypothetical protein MOJ78_03695 [Alkalihalobacillus sp. AL-G]